LQMKKFPDRLATVPSGTWLAFSPFEVALSDAKEKPDHGT
jgi:hypothetical protein